MLNARALCAAVVLGFAGLTGCATGPDYRPPELDAPAAFNGAAAKRGAIDDSGAREDLSAWWRNLDDPLLTALVEEAIVRSPDLRMAQARLWEARARRRAAGAARYPTTTAGAWGRTAGSSRGADNVPRGAAEPAAPHPRTQFVAGFDASWELDVFGRLRRGVEAAMADEESSEASLYDVQVSLAAEVARGYFEVRSLQLRMGLARSNLESQGETLALAKYREEAGLASSQDADQARANREQLEALIPTLETALTEAEHRLDVLLGKQPGTLRARLAAGGRLPALPDRVAIGIPADTLRQRPDVRAAERKLAAETARVGVATAALYPSFKLSGSIGVEAVAQTLIGNPAGAFYSLLGGITAPIFNRGRLRAQVAAQDAVREQTLVTYEQTVLGALEEVENALVGLVQARERAEALTRAAASAQSAALVARERYASGLIEFQPLLDSQRSVQSAQDGLASARAEGVLALVRLYKALGGGWSAPAAAEPQAHVATGERS